jgi:hypothetical protein
MGRKKLQSAMTGKKNGKLREGRARKEEESPPPLKSLRPTEVFL